MAKRRPTLADAVAARHLREEAGRTTTEQSEQRRFRRYVGIILVTVVAIGLVVAWTFFDVGAYRTGGG
jgi:energy-coupling factor transporter transmembrane protein EcfT